jgi:hypothetical protein
MLREERRVERLLQVKQDGHCKILSKDAGIQLLGSTNVCELTKADVNLYAFAPLRLPNANVKATNPSLATQIFVGA